MDYLDVPVEQLLQEPQGKWSGFIGSHEDCTAMRDKLNSAQLVDVDSATDDFPHTPEAKREHAYQLWEAMVDYSDYIEAADNKPHYQVGRVKAMSEVEMEVLAWELLKAIENAYLGTLGFTVTADSAKRKATWRYSSFGSFGARFDKVKEACRKSKSIVYNLTTSSFILKLTADPEYELNSKKENKIINDRRAINKKSAKAVEAPAGLAGPSAPAPVVDAAPSQPGRTVPGTLPPPQAPGRVRAGRVTKTKQRGSILSQHTAAGLENTFTQPTATGLVNSSSQHTATGLGNSSSQPTTTGLANSFPEPTATGLGNSSSQYTAAGLASSFSEPTATGLGNFSSQHTAAGLATPFPQHTASGPANFGNSSSPYTAAGLGISSSQYTATGPANFFSQPTAIGPGHTNHLVAPAPGPPGQDGAGQGRPATVEEMLRAPLDATGRDRRYGNVVKGLLRRSGGPGGGDQ